MVYYIANFTTGPKLRIETLDRHTDLFNKFKRLVVDILPRLRRMKCLTTVTVSQIQIFCGSRHRPSQRRETGQQLQQKLERGGGRVPKVVGGYHR